MAQGRCVLALEQTQPGGLANDSGLGGLIVIETRVAGGGVIAAGDASGGNASIRVRGEDTASLSTVRSLKSRRFLVPLGHVVPGYRSPRAARIVGRGIHSEPSLAPL